MFHSCSKHFLSTYYMFNAILGTHQNRQTFFPSWWIRKLCRGGPELLPGIKQQSGPCVPSGGVWQRVGPQGTEGIWESGRGCPGGDFVWASFLGKTFLWFVSWMDCCPHPRGHLLPAAWSADCESCRKSWTHEPAQVRSAQACVGVCICVWLGVVCGGWETEGICIAQGVRNSENKTNLASSKNLLRENWPHKRPITPALTSHYLTLSLLNPILRLFDR